MQSGDGWSTCAAGHRHWGRFGAAGMLITDGQRIILQHRSPWTHEGDSFGLLGGARHEGEEAVAAAGREAAEESGIDPRQLRPIAAFVEDHGGWSYTTVLAHPLAELDPHAANAESESVAWVPIGAVADLPLHHSFARSWPRLRAGLAVRPLILVVGPNGQTDLRLNRLARLGVPTEQLPSKMSASGWDRLYPQVVSVAGDTELASAIVSQADYAQTVVIDDPADLELLAGPF